MYIESKTYPAGDANCQAHIICPSNDGVPRPAVLVAHQWAGPTTHEHESASRLAELGYVGIAIDVYGTDKRGDPAGDNSALMAPFMQDRVLLAQRMLSAVAFARDHPAVDPDRIAVIGYCFGGLCALDVARSGTGDVRGVVSFHGALSAPPSVNEIRAKVLILHGWDDPLVPPADVVAAANEFTAAGADWQLNAYGNAMHAFTMPVAARPERGLLYNADADKRSWAAMASFLQEIFV